MNYFVAFLLFLFLPVLSAATVSVAVSGQTGPAFSTRLNTNGIEVGRFTWQATGGDVVVESVTIHFNDPDQAAIAVTSIRLFYDADNNGTFSLDEELDEAQVPNGTDDFVTFQDSFTVPDGQIRTMQLRASIGSDAAAYGFSITFRIDDEASVILDDPVEDDLDGDFPLAVSPVTVRHSENRVQPGIGNPTAPREAEFGAQDVAALHFLVESLMPISPGQLDGINLDAIDIAITFADAEEVGAAVRLTLWQDNGNGLFEPGAGEVLIQERTPDDIGKWAVNGSVVTVTFDGAPIQALPGIPPGSTQVFWVGIDFGGSGEATCEVSVNRTDVIGSLGPLADWFVTSPPTVGGNVIFVVPGSTTESFEAQGEGGCSTSEGFLSPLWWLLLLLPVFLRILRTGRVFF